MKDPRIWVFQEPFVPFSNEVLGSILGLEPKILHVLPDYKNDLFVVAIGRMNRP